MPDQDMLKKIDHIGIACRSLSDIKDFYQTIFELQPVFEEVVASQKVRVAGFRVGESNIEYLEPTEADSPIGKFLERRGEGLHHLAVSVRNIEQVLETMKAKGLKLIDEKPRIGAEGKKIAFIHPKSSNGVLLELSESVDE